MSGQNLAGAKSQNRAAELFGRRLRAERDRRGWTVRETARQAGIVSFSTVSRAESGFDIYLSSAVALAGAVDIALADMVAEVKCGTCMDDPPAGFTCRTCGADGAE